MQICIKSCMSSISTFLYGPVSNCNVTPSSTESIFAVHSACATSIDSTPRISDTFSPSVKTQLMLVAGSFPRPNYRIRALFQSFQQQRQSHSLHVHKWIQNVAWLTCCHMTRTSPIRIWEKWTDELSDNHFVNLPTCISKVSLHYTRTRKHTRFTLNCYLCTLKRVQWFHKSFWNFRHSTH